MTPCGIIVRNYFGKYYRRFAEIKDFNALIGHKSTFDQFIKSKQEAYQTLVETSRNDEYTTGTVLDYSYQNYCKLMA